ncbi:MAG: hypothetical protein D3906_01335 [Candidatus Electrothrix sp. AUS1_2]|nr:hypothetical protein [Candidatus Electrothrix sp. AUS1_2]
MKRKILSAYITTALITGFAGTQATAGILAEGNISVYKGGKQINSFTGQNPVDEEALLVCNDRCMVKTTGVSIVGTAGSELAVKDGQEQFNLLLKKGKLDFVLTGSVGKMGFYTADKQYVSADVVYNVSSSSPVRGYMELTSTGDTKIGVSEGRLVFNSVEGVKTIDSNNYILLAQADVGGGAVGAGTAGGGAAAGAAGGAAATGIAGIGTTALVAGGVVAAGVAWGAYEYQDDDDDPVVPSSRTTPASPYR